MALSTWRQAAYAGCAARSDLAGGVDLKPMSLGLSHSLSRYKLKFSPDKVRHPPCWGSAGRGSSSRAHAQRQLHPLLGRMRPDWARRPSGRRTAGWAMRHADPRGFHVRACAQVDTMIVQAIGLLDDLDKELNTYAMRVREWFGWHFPEMTKIVSDNIAYAKVVRARSRSTPLASPTGRIAHRAGCTGQRRSMTRTPIIACRRRVKVVLSWVECAGGELPIGGCSSAPEPDAGAPVPARR